MLFQEKKKDEEKKSPRTQPQALFLEDQIKAWTSMQCSHK